MAAVGWPPVRQLIRVILMSAFSTTRVRQNSLMPMPVALPWVASVRSRTQIRLIFGHSSSIATWSLYFRPMTFVSIPAPLMFLPI